MYGAKKYIHVYVHVHTHTHVFIIYMHTDMNKYIHIHIHILEIIIHTNISNSSNLFLRFFLVFSHLIRVYSVFHNENHDSTISTHLLICKVLFLSSHILLHTQKTVIFEKLVMYTIKNNAEAIFHPLYQTKLQKMENLEKYCSVKLRDFINL